MGVVSGNNLPDDVSPRHPRFTWEPREERPLYCEECGYEFLTPPDYGDSVECAKCGEMTTWHTDEELAENAEYDAADRAYDAMQEESR